MTFSLLEAQPLEFETYKLGMQGWAVAVCQLNLNTHFKVAPLIVDGVFGPETERIAKQLQHDIGLRIDGVVGPVTQEAFVKAKMKHAEKGTTPAGLLAGLCDIEASYEWACVSEENSNETHDYGVTQESLKDPTLSELRIAFNVDASGHILAGEISGYFNAIIEKVGNVKRAWQIAALSHNWPVASAALVHGEENWLDKPFAFTTAKGYPTGLAYAEHYMAVATEQVSIWSVA